MKETKNTTIISKCILKVIYKKGKKYKADEGGMSGGLEKWYLLHCYYLLAKDDSENVFKNLPNINFVMFKYELFCYTHILPPCAYFKVKY